MCERECESNSSSDVFGRYNASIQVDVVHEKAGIGVSPGSPRRGKEGSFIDNHKVTEGR